MSEYLPKIQTAFHEAFGTDKNTVAQSSVPEDIEGWDSLGHAQIVTELETVFDTQFTIDEVMEMDDVEAIIRVLKNKNVSP